jgi:uncharacterized membrane protein
MSFFGSLHVAAAVLALVVAAIVLVRRKGTTAHVRLGRVYVVLLVLVDAFALLTYRNGIGPFHLLAVISLATLSAGVVWSPRRRGSRQTHGILMIWSVAGLVAAGLAQGATAAIPQASPWPTVATTASVCLLATLATRALTRRRSSTKWLTPQTVSRQRGVWSVSAPDRV